MKFYQHQLHPIRQLFLLYQAFYSPLWPLVKHMHLGLWNPKRLLFYMADNPQILFHHYLVSWWLYHYLCLSVLSIFSMGVKFVLAFKFVIGTKGFNFTLSMSGMSFVFSFLQKKKRTFEFAASHFIDAECFVKPSRLRSIFSLPIPGSGSSTKLVFAFFLSL